MAKPDFIGIGMERAGTSWLFYMLASHPDVWVPPIKEIHYFDSIDPPSKEKLWRFKKHLKARILAKAAPFIKSPEERPQFFKNSWREYLKWDMRYFRGHKTHDWYRSLFAEEFAKGRISGEITAKYATLSEDVVRDLAKEFPDTKIILSVRDPIERMVSALIYHFKGRRKRRLESVCEEEMLAWLSMQDYHSTSDVVSLWKKYIKPQNLVLIDFNDIVTAPEDLILYLYTRLNLDPSFQPPETLIKKKIFSFRGDHEHLPDSIMQKISNMCTKEHKTIIKAPSLSS